MTPVHAKPSHVDTETEHYSNVYDAKLHGCLVATFYGYEHRNNAELFCKLFHGYDEDGNAEKIAGRGPGDC